MIIMSIGFLVHNFQLMILSNIDRVKHWHSRCSRSHSEVAHSLKFEATRLQVWKVQSAIKHPLSLYESLARKRERENERKRAIIDAIARLFLLSLLLNFWNSTLKWQADHGESSLRIPQCNAIASDELAIFRSIGRSSWRNALDLLRTIYTEVARGSNRTVRKHKSVCQIQSGP